MLCFYSYFCPNASYSKLLFALRFNFITQLKFQFLMAPYLKFLKDKSYFTL